MAKRIEREGADNLRARESAMLGLEMIAVSIRPAKRLSMIFDVGDPL